jgi:hypothetical protein
MTSRSRRTIARARRLLAVAGALMIVASAGVLGTGLTARAAGRSVTVTPAEGLTNEVVRVSWTGFHPTDANGNFVVIVVQCSADPRSLADCFTGESFPSTDQGNKQLARTGDDGTGSTLFEVRPAANLPQLACSATRACSLLVYENDGVPIPSDALPASAVVAPIRFAPSQADCPAITDFDLRADGEASAAPVFYRWAAERCTGVDKLVLDFTETSSNAGRENFLNRLVDIGVTSLPASEEELASAPNHLKFAYAPLDLTAVAVVVNMKDPFTGQRIDDLTLTPRLVARLVTDSDVTAFFGDPELRTLNPTVRFPSIGLSPPLLRAERNADTRLVTSWMASDNSAQRFLADRDTYAVRINPAYIGYPYPRDTFENVAQSSQFLPRTGQGNVGLRMFYGVRPAGSNAENLEEIGFIGIMDLPAAHRFGLPTAKVVNASGVPVSPTEDSILAGFRNMTATPERTLVANPAAKARDAYPFVKVDYAMAPLNAVEAKAKHVSSLLRFAAGAGQDSLPAGYVALPPSLRAQTRAVADRIAPDGTATTPTTATTTTTTTVPPDAPAPTPAPYDGSNVSAGATAGGASGLPTGDRAAADGSPPTPTSLRVVRTSAATLATDPSNLLLPGLLLVLGLGLVAWGAPEAPKVAARVSSASAHARRRIRGRGA